jgi:hypothetical protein
VSAPWGSPGANPLADIRAFIREAERAGVTVRPFAVLAPPPLGCPDCGMALPSCHEQHSREHCERHDRPTCEWARGAGSG